MCVCCCGHAISVQDTKLSRLPGNWIGPNPDQGLFPWQSLGSVESFCFTSASPTPPSWEGGTSSSFSFFFLFFALKDPFFRMCQRGMTTKQTGKVENLMSTMELDIQSYANHIASLLNVHYTLLEAGLDGLFSNPVKRRRPGREKCRNAECGRKNMAATVNRSELWESAAPPINILICCKNLIVRKICCCAVRQGRKAGSVSQIIKRRLTSDSGRR